MGWFVLCFRIDVLNRYDIPQQKFEVCPEIIGHSGASNFMTLDTKDRVFTTFLKQDIRFKTIQGLDTSRSNVLPVFVDLQDFHALGLRLLTTIRRHRTFEKQFPYL